MEEKLTNGRKGKKISRGPSNCEALTAEYCSQFTVVSK